MRCNRTPSHLRESTICPMTRSIEPRRFKNSLDRTTRSIHQVERVEREYTEEKCRIDKALDASQSTTKDISISFQHQREAGQFEMNVRTSMLESIPLQRHHHPAVPPYKSINSSIEKSITFASGSQILRNACGYGTSCERRSQAHIRNSIRSARHKTINARLRLQQVAGSRTH